MDFAVVLSAIMGRQGVGVRELARQVPCDPGAISRLASGKRRPSAQMAARLDDVLSAGGELAASAKAAAWKTPQAGDRDGDDVLRREFGAALAAALAPTAVPQGRDHGPGRRVGMDLAGDLAARTARLRGLDNYLGGAGTYRLYAAELESTLGVLREGSYAAETGCVLLSVAAEQAQQAGWAAFDAGWSGPAKKLYEMSLTAATQAGDAPLAANSLLLIAYQQVSGGQPGTGAATAACRMADSGGAPPGVRMLMHERAAWAHAVVGQAGECERELGAAADAVSAGGDGQPAPGWAEWADASELQIMTGRCMAALRRPRQAIAVLEDVLARFDERHARDLALYLSWLAQAHLDAGEIEQAASVTGRVLSLSDGVGSARPAQRTAVLLRALAPHRASRSVAELLDRASGYLTQQPE